MEKLKKLVDDLLEEDCKILDWESKPLGEGSIFFVKEGEGLNVLINNKEGKHVAQFRMIQFPGCCGICVSYHSRVYENYRNKGLGNALHNFRLKLARDLGYTLMICTDVATNEFQKKLLSKNGWKDVYSFNNKRTRNNVDISIVNL